MFVSPDLCVSACLFLFLALCPTSQPCLSLSRHHFCLSLISSPHLYLPVSLSTSVPPETFSVCLSFSPSPLLCLSLLIFVSSHFLSLSPPPLSLARSLAPTVRLRIHFSFCGDNQGDHSLLHPCPSPQAQASGSRPQRRADFRKDFPPWFSTGVLSLGPGGARAAPWLPEAPGRDELTASWLGFHQLPLPELPQLLVPRGPSWRIRRAPAAPERRKAEAQAPR